MKAEKAIKLVEEYLHNQKDLRIKTIENRIESGLYDKIFTQIKMAAGSGRHSVNIYVTEPEIEINIYMDFRHLGYKVTGLDALITGANYQINWNTR